MRFQVIFRDITADLKSGDQPILYVDRPLAGAEEDSPAKPFSVAKPGRVGDYWVPTNPILAADPGWSPPTKCDKVRVPMYSYKTATPSKVRLVASGIEIGCAIMTLLPLLKYEPIEMTIIMGHEVHHTKEGYDFYVGLMVRTK